MNYSFFSKTRISFFLCIIVVPVHADLPLTVEDLTTDRNRFRFDANFSYFNQSHSSLNYQGFNLIDINGQTLAIPNLPTTGTKNTDSLLASIGIRYGLSNDLDMGIFINGISSEQRLADGVGNNTSVTDAHLQNIYLNSQYQLTKNHSIFPDSLLFFGVSAYDNSNGLVPRYGSSASIGSTIYTVNDPVSLSLSASYQYNGSREYTTSGVKVDVGDVFSLSSRVGFAVNPDITLTSGVGWRLKQADTLSGVDNIGNRRTQTSLSFGLAYALSARTNLTANVRSNISGNSGSTVSIGFTTKLGKLPPPLSARYRQKLHEREQNSGNSNPLPSQ